jgi:hypothetical protein
LKQLFSPSQLVQSPVELNYLEIERQKDRRTERQKDREMERQKYRTTERQKDGKTGRQKDRKTERQKDRKTERQIQTEGSLESNSVSAIHVIMVNFINP